MAQQDQTVMPPASSQQRPLMTVMVLAAAVLVGAAVMYVVLRPEAAGPVAQGPAPSTAVPAAAADAVTACLGGADPATAVVAAMRAPATVDGAAQAAAGVVRFTESKAFGDPAALTVIKRVADALGSPSLVELQKGQAPYIAQMTATAPKVSRGAFVTATELQTPTVTVLVPVEWSTAQAQHYDWRFIDVKLQRLEDRWAVVSAGSTARVSEQLQPLRGADVQAGDLDRYGAALTVEGFRRYSGDC